MTKKNATEKQAGTENASEESGADAVDITRWTIVGAEPVEGVEGQMRMTIKFRGRLLKLTVTKVEPLTFGGSSVAL